MKKEIDKELLIRYINNNCTAEDLLQVQQFLKDPMWKLALEKMLESDFSAMEDPPQADEAVLEEWDQEFRTKYFKKPPIKFWHTQWMNYAAACLLVLGAGAYYLSKQRAERVAIPSVAMVEKTNPRGVRSKVTLPDSSVVYLGPGSSISFPEQFAVKERTLTLTGEAFFEISKNPERPFVIHTGEIQTTVLGTSFKITAFKDNLLSVEVATGKVRVSRKENTKVAELAVLIPGEGIIWNEKRGKAEAIHTDISAVKSWATGEISFKNRSLPQIAAELENWYDVEIHFANTTVVRKHLSLSIDGTASLADALDIICTTAHLNYHFNGKRQVVLSDNK